MLNKAIPQDHITPKLAHSKYGFGWRPDTPNRKDLSYSAPRAILQSLPEYVDLCETGHMPPIYDQSSIGSCVGNGVARLMHYIHKREGHPNAAQTPSRLMIYWLARYLENTINSDAGCEIRDAIKSVVSWGVAFEDGGTGPAIWPYDTSKFTVRPPNEAFAAASLFRAIEYSRIQQDAAHQMRGCLAEFHPFVFGSILYDSFESDEVERTGIVPMPLSKENMLGGHCMTAVGYDDTGKHWPARHFKVANSWGPNWGSSGYCFIPYEYLGRKDLTSDLWTIRVVS